MNLILFRPRDIPADLADRVTHVVRSESSLRAILATRDDGDEVVVLVWDMEDERVALKAAETLRPDAKVLYVHHTGKLLTQERGNYPGSRKVVKLAA